MKAIVRNPLLPAWCKWSAVVLSVGLTACSFGSGKPEPAPLTAVTAQIPAKQVWRTQIGEVSPLMTPTVKGNGLFVANAEGVVYHINTDTGRQVWRAAVGNSLTAGVGSDGELAAVVTRDNELLALSAGKELWRVRIPARVFTAPLVAGQRVFVLAADRSVHAFDGKTGARLWSQASRGGDSLVLQQAGVLLAVGDTLVAGNGGRLTGINPANGSQRWSAAVANSRGTNEVERLVDLVAHAGRVEETVCVRAYQAAIGCVDAGRGTLQWTKPAIGAVGVHADEDQMYGIEGNDRVVAWKRSSGEQVWTNEKFSYRGMTAPLAAGRSIAIGDAQGFVHLLSRTDGSLLNRLSTDGSAVVYAPVLAGRTLMVVTREGGVFGWRPE